MGPGRAAAEGRVMGGGTKERRGSWKNMIVWQRRVRLQSNASEIYSTCDMRDVTSPKALSAARPLGNLRASSTQLVQT